MIQFQESTSTDNTTEVWTDSTVVHKAIPANTGGPTGTTAVVWHLKSKI